MYLELWQIQNQSEVHVEVNMENHCHHVNFYNKIEMVKQNQGNILHNPHSHYRHLSTCGFGMTVEE